MNMATKDYREHLREVLVSSSEEAAGYIAANLRHNLDSPQTIALALQDVVNAYELGIDISLRTSPARQQLEHSLATGFIKLQKEWNPAARQAQWVKLQRLASEIERLSE